MKWLCLALLVALIMSSAYASTTPEVIELEDSNFIASIQELPEAVWLVEFYAPWCGFCQKLAPIWEDLARALHARDDQEFRVVKVDATQHPNSAKMFGVRGYPTIKLIKGDKYYEVNTPRTVEAYTELVEKGEWPNGEAFPPEKMTIQPVPHPVDEHDDIPFNIEWEKIPDELTLVVTTKMYAAGLLAIFGFLVGVLAALLCCFPNPRIVYLQESSQQPATGPKIKEE